jgi:hypothetical protein
MNPPSHLRNIVSLEVEYPFLEKLLGLDMFWISDSFGGGI